MCWGLGFEVLGLGMFMITFLVWFGSLKCFACNGNDGIMFCVFVLAIHFLYVFSIVVVLVQFFIKHGIS